MYFIYYNIDILFYHALCYSDDLASHYPNSSPKGTDEQSVLNKILQETATYVCL